MSILTEIATSVGSSIVAAVFIWKLTDIFRDKDVRDLLISVFRAKDISEAAKSYIQAIYKIMDITFTGQDRVLKILTIYLSSSLVRSIASISKQIIEAAPEEKKAKTVVGLMLGEKIEKSSRSQFYLVMALVASLSFSLFMGSGINGIALLVISMIFLGIQVDQKLIEYRIKSGWYGKNEFETREIINFIISHANKDDFNDSGGLKRVIPEPELKESENTSIVTGGTTA